jgi:hypothetical protein
MIAAAVAPRRKPDGPGRSMFDALLPSQPTTDPALTAALAEAVIQHQSGDPPPKLGQRLKFAKKI